MGRGIAAPLWLAVVVALATAARGDGAQPAGNVAPDPWSRDRAMIENLAREISQDGIMAVAPHAAELEAALAGAKQSIALADSRNIYLASGATDTLAQMALAMSKGKSATAVPDPYALIAMDLGVYYDEVKRPEDALRVLDLGLALASDLSDMRTPLTIERGAALMGLKRWDEVVANEDAGLKLAVIEIPAKATLYRGRGYALTELNRLDEAEDAYKESLNLEPGNELATHELAYIHGLKLGAPRAPGGLKPLAPPAEGRQPQETPAPSTDRPDRTL
ncbi:MAG TPA: tetratricopeptide repeat protein [Rhizomicrobium sp.]|jgi:tetratricopeptide (TPR) repeat protein|nr:tetratricopeptide repeat protein [Rhizomicrobium sp.]